MVVPTLPGTGTIVTVHRNQPRSNHTLESLRLSPVVQISLQKELNLARTVGIFLILSFIFIFFSDLMFGTGTPEIEGIRTRSGTGARKFWI